MDKLMIRSDAFQEGGWIPVRYTAHGEDVSPDFTLAGIAPEAGSIAMTMDDVSAAIFSILNHWVIWNIPVSTHIRQAVPHGATIGDPEGAVQGIGYGRHRYAGPKPPFHQDHTYVFTVYILDAMIDLPPKGRKRDLLLKIEGHILQKATFSGHYQHRRKEE